MSRYERFTKRIYAHGFTPRAGDVFTKSTRRGFFLVVNVGHPHAGYSVPKASIFKRSGGKWEFYENVSPDLDGFAGYSLVDVGFSDFFFVGYGPTGRPHVLFKTAAGVVYRAGCRTFTQLASAVRHWNKSSRRDQWFRKADMARAAWAEARRLGWLKVKRQPPVKKAKRKAVRR